MGERLKQLLEFLPEKIRELPPSRLFVLLGLLGSGIAVGLVSLLWMSGDAEKQLLYSQLSMEDSAAITAKLKEMNVPYELKGDGTTIMIPSTVVHDVRLRLATEGLPQGGGIGFELFDKNNFGMTEYMQKLNFRRALQGELARTIGELASVRTARVHIVLPEKTLFTERQEATTASVVLKLIPGSQLSQKQIRGITHLVANSVEGLDPGNITIVDTAGHILSRPEQDTAFLTRTEGQLAYQQSLERDLERRVQSLLERAVGEGKVMVRVSASLDFQHVERTEERFNPDEPAVRSEQRSEEEGSGPGFWAIGVPGVRSNVEQTQQDPNQKNEKTSSSRKSATINYELSKTVSKIVSPSGEIKQLSVAVLVDGAYQPGAQEGETTYVPRTEEELAKYREVVRSAVGFNEARGDKVEVANMPFESHEDFGEQELAKEAQRAFWLKIGRYGVYALLGLLFFLFLVRPLVGWATGDQQEAETILPRTVHELESDLGVAGALTGANGEAGEGVRQLGMSTATSLRDQVIEFIKTEPDRAVEIVRVWLNAQG